MTPEQQDAAGPAKAEGSPPRFNVQLDREHYTVSEEYLSGLQLRALVTPPVASDRDLFEVVPGGSDRKIGNEDLVHIKSGLRFFTAPALINPGR